jgi:SPP1 gp7 family putative phage head morphogenesis protein
LKRLKIECREKMERNIARQTLKLLLYTRRANLKAAQRNRPVKRAAWAYPAAAERRYAALIGLWARPLYDFAAAFVKKRGEALARGDAAGAGGIRADALPGGAFTVMVSSLRGFAAQYLPENPGGVTDGPSLYLGLGEVSEELFKANKRQWDRQSKSSIGVTFPDTAGWWPSAKKLWQDTNYTLIKSMISDNIAKVNALAEQAVVNGWGVDMLASELRKANTKNSNGKIKQIARDQIGKLNGIVTQARMQSVGLELYVWSASGDERVRAGHKLMDGKLCRWDDAAVYSGDGGKTWKKRPSGAVLLHPGMDIMCRCVALSYFDELVGEVDKEIEGKKAAAYETAGKAAPVSPAPLNMKPAKKANAPKFSKFENAKGEILPKVYDEHLAKSKNWVNSLTNDENTAMIHYTGNDYKDMNNLLFGFPLNKPHRKKEYEKYIDGLDRALLKYPLENNIVIYRGDNPRNYEGWKVGGEYTITGYQSGAVIKGSAWTQKGMVITIRVPKGTPGAYIDGHGSYPNEEEYLLGRNLKYKVLKKTVETMEVQVIL